ncbi:MAG: metallophosphoesterase, partial [Leptospiraceae bacterium]|nr:metallophosphoesterase [Leptospiraceae bacterium]
VRSDLRARNAHSRFYWFRFFLFLDAPARLSLFSNAILAGAICLLHGLPWYLPVESRLKVPHISGLIEPIRLRLELGESMSAWLSVLSLAISAGVLLLLDLIVCAFARYKKHHHASLASQIITMQIPRLLVSIACALLAAFGNSFSALCSIYLYVALQTLGTALYLKGFWFETGAAAVRITRREIFSPKINRPINFAHLSDIHLDRRGVREDFALRRLAAEAPDFIVITGDYLNLSNVEDPESHRQLIALLNEMGSIAPVLAVAGTASTDRRALLEKLFQQTFNVRLIRDESILLPDVSLNIIGLDCDHHPVVDPGVYHHLIQSSESASDTFRKSFSLLLYHSPELMPHFKNRPPDLYLCGHTHGGQIRIPGMKALYTSSSTGRKYDRGYFEDCGTRLYINSGLGLEGKSAPRMRLFCPPELCFWRINNSGS